MKTNTEKICDRVVISFVLFLFVACSQIAKAQTNTFPASGSVGIGTTAPNFNLDVNRGATATDVVLGIDSNGSNAYSPMLYFRNAGTAISKIMTAQDLQFQNTNNNPLLYLKTNGNFGVGTTNPQYKLDVAGNINATGVNINGSPITSSQWTTSGTTINYSAGNVGVGTANPTYKLHITGDGRFTGNLTVDGNLAAKYQDVAEWVPTSEQLAAGTVVVLDSSKSNQVIASVQAYDTRVAGVVSERPGIALGERGNGKVLVATTGRVRVNVNATRTPIHIGDLLVTSDIPGVAMKSEPVNLGGVQIHRPGTLIGKALEPLEKGSGTILVLLSLQ